MVADDNYITFCEIRSSYTILILAEVDATMHTDVGKVCKSDYLCGQMVCMDWPKINDFGSDM
jgi:hypothetical protein